MMILKKAEIDNNGKIIVKDSVKKFYLRTNKELIPDSNYYVAFYINDTNISFTNKFKKLIENDVELYELDLFLNHIDLHLNKLSWYCHSVTFIGFEYPDTTNIDVFKEIYYEESQELNINKYFNGNESVITYHDSQLANDIRTKYSGHLRDACSEHLGVKVDNVLIIMNVYVLTYTNGKTYLDDIYSLCNSNIFKIGSCKIINTSNNDRNSITIESLRG
jgi:hypothetical protein